MTITIDLRFALLLLVFPAFHAIKYIILIRRADFYIDEYIKYWKDESSIDFLIHKTRINYLLKSANYRPKTYVVTEYDKVNPLILHRQVAITDIFLRQEYSQEFIDTMKISRGELQRLLLLLFSPCYWIKKIIFIPIRVLSLFGFHVKKTMALLVSLLGWTVTYLLTAYQDKIKEILDNLLNKLMS